MRLLQLFESGYNESKNDSVVSYRGTAVGTYAKAPARYEVPHFFSLLTARHVLEIHFFLPFWDSQLIVDCSVGSIDVATVHQRVDFFFRKLSSLCCVLNWDTKRIPIVDLVGEAHVDRRVIFANL